jgi:hypothetical protein
MPRFGPFELDPVRRQLSRDSLPVHLTPKAFDLLKILVDAAPRVVTKTELHKRLWPATFVADATLVGLVKEIRRALDDRDRDAPLIRTAHRVGYAFCPTLEGTPAGSAQVCGWLVVGERRIPLIAGESVLGREPGADVWLDYATVSRRHALIVADPNTVSLRDLGSKNGTRVGEQVLVGMVVLRDGDRIYFGQLPAMYRAPGAALATVSQVGRADDFLPQR